MWAVLGIPALIRFLGWLVAAVIGWFGDMLSRRGLRIAVSMTVYLTILFAVINECYTSLETAYSSVFSVLPDSVASVISFIIPSNALLCVSFILTLKVIGFIYDIKLSILDFTGSLK
ncbi:hypothetical protein DVQ78_19500 [Yersinia enterocolitica]|nr:hypothetical protein [Yersinia enterocolitica]